MRTVSFLPSLADESSQNTACLHVELTFRVGVF